MMRAVAFHGLVYATMGVMGIVGAPFVLWREAWTRAWQKRFCRAVFWFLNRLYGVTIEVRGAVPTGDVIIAAKHQSMLDVLILYNALPRARFVMKRSLLWMPAFGLYAWRTGAVSIDRRPGSGATEKMLEAFTDAPGQIVVYPQGTRVAPGASAPYRRGVARLAKATGRGVIPVGTNSGFFWRRGGTMTGPGTAVIAFGDPLNGPGTRGDLMAEIERCVEACSDALAHQIISKRG
ncbi:MAG: lysophospholipid acyltransferase family protein [Pseudomonadota bacterium]